MKKALALALAFGLTFAATLSGCSGSKTSDNSEETETETTTTADSESSDEGEETEAVDGITLLNGKPEVDAQMQELADLYLEETGDAIQIISVQPNEKASDRLVEMQEEGNLPDIFVCEADDFDSWSGQLEDLSEEEWMQITSLAYEDPDEGVIGFPYMVEACGLTYNKAILDKAGVDPASLTGPEAYREAFEKIDSQKEDLGIDAVVAYATNPEEVGWSTGTHVFGQYLDAGLEPSDSTYIEMLNEGGSIDSDRMTKFAEFVGLLNQYADADILTDGTYDDQVSAFASGRCAFITQGSWIGALLTGKFNAEYAEAGAFEAGIAPFAFEEDTNRVLDGPTSYWAVSKDGNVEKAKQFLLWCSMDTAQQIFVDEAGFISPFDNCPFEATDPLASSVTEWLRAGNNSSFHTFLKKEGLEDPVSEVFAKYAKGEIADAQAFADEIQTVCKDYYSE
ncbi:MAG: extracellular solute-binding protein [Lachnospiraceae bacterium]|nr:extracellular solute-binding protein [Lachnospiraceae bacterium]